MSKRKFMRSNSRGLLSKKGIMRALYTNRATTISRPNHSTIKELLADKLVVWNDGDLILTKWGRIRCAFLFPDV